MKSVKPVVEVVEVVKTTAEIVREQIAAMPLDERRKIFPPKEMKNFVVRKNWYGRGQLIKFTSNKGIERVYDHDKVYDLMEPSLRLKNAWNKYGYWSQSTDLPMIIRFRNDLLGDADAKAFAKEIKVGK